MPFNLHGQKSDALCFILFYWLQFYCFLSCPLRSHTLPTLMPGLSNLDVPPSPSHGFNNSRSSPRGSPRGSPRASPRSSPRHQRRHNELGSRASFGGSGSDKEKSPTHLNWTKSQWRRKVIRKRQGSTCRSNSVSSDRSESPGEKMVRKLSYNNIILLIIGEKSFLVMARLPYIYFSFYFSSFTVAAVMKLSAPEQWKEWLWWRRRWAGSAPGKRKSSQKLQQRKAPLLECPLRLKKRRQRE